MYIARWSFNTQFARTDDCISILRKWAVDVGEVTGWRISSLRALRGVAGAPQTAIELEARFESLAELESAWKDMESSHHHKEYMQKLQVVLVPGSSLWTVLEDVSLAPKG